MQIFCSALYLFFMNFSSINILDLYEKVTKSSIGFRSLNHNTDDVEWLKIKSLLWIKYSDNHKSGSNYFLELLTRGKVCFACPPLAGARCCKVCFFYHCFSVAEMVPKDVKNFHGYLRQFHQLSKCKTFCHFSKQIGDVIVYIFGVIF